MANDRTILDAIAAGLAESREPDLSSFDPAQVRLTIRSALQDSAARLRLLNSLNASVQRLSGGKVSIEERAVHQPLGTALQLSLLIIKQDEPFAEPVTLRPDYPIVTFVMRG